MSSSAPGPAKHQVPLFPSRGKYPDDLELGPTTKDSQSQPLKFQLYLVPGGEHWGVNYMLAVHYSNITQKGKFGTIDSIKILRYRTNLTNITRQLYVLLPSYKLLAGEEGKLPPLLPSDLLFEWLQTKTHPEQQLQGRRRTLWYFSLWWSW